MELLSKEQMSAFENALKNMKKNGLRVTYDQYVKMANENVEKHKAEGYANLLTGAREAEINYGKPYLVNIRGANGTGKSTVPILMTLTDPDVVFVCNDNGTEILTYCPNYNMTLMGRYYTKTGGLDVSTYQDKFYISEVLRRIWKDVNTNILMEGIVCSSSYGFYADMFKELEPTENARDVLIMNIIMDLDDLEKRIMVRNGGKQIKMHYVHGKQATVTRNVPKFERDGFNSWVTENKGVPFHDMVFWFFEELAQHRLPSVKSEI